MSFYIPGPLLRPSGISPDGIFYSVKSYGGSQVNLTQITYVQVTNTGVVFCDSKKLPVFEKKFAFIEVEVDVFDPHRVDFRSSPRIWDDIRVVTLFDTQKDAADVLDKIQQASPPQTRQYELPTKTYVLEGDTAKLLPTVHPISGLVNQALSALAYTDVTEVLNPSWTGCVLKRPVYVVHNVKDTIQRWLQSHKPPLVIIAREGIDVCDHTIIFRDDLNGNFDDDTLPTLPQFPIWPLQHVVPPNELWLSEMITNYGIWHQRRRETNAEAIINQPWQPMITLSLELVRWFLAAMQTVSAGSSSPGAIMSLQSAAASIKTTIVHQMSFLGATNHENGLYDTPHRSRIDGANTRRFDAAEDEERPGMIEIGNLVETAWLGGPHKLVLDSEGWLRFVTITHLPIDSAAFATADEQDRLQPVIVCPEEILESLWAPGLPRLRNGIVGDSSLLIRNKRSEPKPSPSGPSLSIPQPPISFKQRVPLITGPLIPLVKGKDLPPKWPSVLGRRGQTPVPKDGTGADEVRRR